MRSTAMPVGAVSWWVAGKNSETVPPGTLRNILKSSGLTMEDL